MCIKINDLKSFYAQKPRFKSSDFFLKLNIYASVLKVRLEGSCISMVCLVFGGVEEALSLRKRYINYSL